MNGYEMSDFLHWFEAQHGKRPSTLPTNELRHQYANADSTAMEARGLLEACEIYDARVQSALYAWNARDTAGMVSVKRELLIKLREYAGMVRSNDVSGDEPIYGVLEDTDALLAAHKEPK